jgi:hypothetical protein
MTSGWIRAIGAMALSAMAALAGAAPLVFGSRSLEVPQPEGFLTGSTAYPPIFSASSAFLPPSNRLVEVYVTQADGDAMVAGKLQSLSRYFQLQVPRALEGKPLSVAEFGANAKTIETSLETAMKDAGSQAGQLTHDGNQRVQQQTGVDPGVKISDVGYHGIFRREDWGIFFSMSSAVSAAGSGSDRMFCAGALALVDHQLVYFYAYALERTPADRDWAKRALSAWVDATRAANPDDDALEASAAPRRNNWLVRVLVFAVLGGVIGVLYGRLRASRG